MDRSLSVEEKETADIPRTESYLLPSEKSQGWQTTN